METLPIKEATIRTILEAVEAVLKDLKIPDIEVDEKTTQHRLNYAAGHNDAIAKVETKAEEIRQKLLKVLNET